MSRRPPDHSLRRLVAELATASPEDVGAVLDDLDPAHRRQVQTLLADYLGEPPAAPAVPSAAIPSPLLGLSAWLTDRLEGKDADAFAMTPAASELLRACAAAMEPSPPVEMPTLPREAGWLSKASRLLIRRRPTP